MHSRLSNFITVDFIKNKPEAHLITDSISQIMIENDIAPTRYNFVNLIVPECIAIAAELDKSQERDIFSVSLDNQLKPLLRASMDLFPLTIVQAKRPETVAEKKDDEVKSEPGKGPTAADPAAGVQSSGPGPINYNINYVRFPSAADKQRKIDELASAAKKRREEEDRQRNLRLRQEYFLRLSHFVRENLKEKNALESEIMQLGERIKSQYDVWNNASIEAHKKVPAQLITDIATHNAKYADYERFISTLYNNGVMNASYIKRHEFTSFTMDYQHLSYAKQTVAYAAASDARLQIAIADPMSQEAMDIRMEGARYMAEVRQKREQEELLKQQQEQQEQLRQSQRARSSYHRQINYR